MQSKLLLMRADHHPFIMGINDERARFLLAVHFNIGEHAEVICHCCVRDEHLISADHITVVGRLRARGERENIRARIGFRERKADLLLPCDDLGQIGVLLLIGSVGHDRIRANCSDEQHERHGGRFLRQTRHACCPAIHAHREPTLLFRHGKTEKTLFSKEIIDVLRKFILFIDLCRTISDNIGAHTVHH